jgi:hypothetical protein
VEIDQSDRPWAPAVWSALAALALYAITLRGTFIYDDAWIILLDGRITHPNLWRLIWTKDYFSGGVDHLYRPLVTQSYAIQFWLHGYRAWAFHLVNLLLNAGVCAAVAELGRRLAGWRVGLIAGLLFAVHPVHSEAVAEIVGRADLFCALGVLVAMILFWHRPITSGRALAIYAISVVAILSKEQGMLIPVLLLALEWLRRRRGGVAPAGPERQAMLLLTALLIWTIGGLIFLREEVLNLKFEWDPVFLDWIIQPLAHAHGWDRVLIPIALLGRYLGLLVAPVRLSIDYGYAVIGTTIDRYDPYLWLGFLTIALGVGAAVLCAARRWWTALFCLAAMAITYSMVANFIVIGTILGEREMYLPSAFFLILLAILVARVSPPIRITVLIVLLCLGALRTFSYIRHWNDRDAFYAYSLEQQPRSIQLHMLVGYCAYEEGRLDDARAVLSRGEQLAPNYWQLWRMSAQVEERAGDWMAALVDYRHAFDTAQNPAGVIDGLNRAAEMVRKALLEPQAQTRAAATTQRSTRPAAGEP